MDSKKNREKLAKEYIQTKLDKIFLPLGTVLKKEQPDNLVSSQALKLIE